MLAHEVQRCFAFRVRSERLLWAVFVILIGALIVLTGRELWGEWRGDARMAHVPGALVIALVLLWRGHRAGAGGTGEERTNAVGLSMRAIGAAFLYVAAAWADVAFVRSLALLLLLAALLAASRGAACLRAARGGLGALLFVIPWPTALTAWAEFTMQRVSSAWAALFSGLAGVPVQRNGLALLVVPDPARPPIYSVLVAQPCSGMTSLLALLLIGYVLAILTPVCRPARVLLMLAAVPLALLANALRIAFVVVVGAGRGAGVAQWVHDHEQPILVFCCGWGLLALRHALMVWLPPAARLKEQAAGDPQEAASEAAGGRRRYPSWAALFAKSPSSGSTDFSFEDSFEACSKARRSAEGAFTKLLALNALLLLTLAGALCATGRADAPLVPDFLAALQLPYGDWNVREARISASDRAALEPDALLLRHYEADARSKRIETPAANSFSANSSSANPFSASPVSQWVELTVIAGRRKRTVHTPAYCLLGDGWETLSQTPFTLRLPGRLVSAQSLRMMRGGQQILVTYFFTDGDFATSSLPYFQVAEIEQRLRGRGGLGALVRIVVPLQDEGQAQQLTADFAARTLPAVLNSILSQSEHISK